MPKNPLSTILDDPLVSGAGDLASRFGRYVGSGNALRDSAGLAVRVAPDLLRGGPSRVLMKHVAEPMAASLTKDFKANPVRTVAENLPVVGGVMSALEAKDLRQKALEARARGDMEGYRRYSEAAAAAAGMTAVGMIPVPGAAGAKTAAKVGVKAAERDAVRDVSRLVEKYGVEVPGVSRDNPGGEWLENAVAKVKAQEAGETGEQSLYAPRAPSGPVTGGLRGSGVMLVNPEKLKDVPGAMREAPAPGKRKYDALMESMGKSGYAPETYDGKSFYNPIVIGVNYAGEPFILEGNNRAAVARALGIPAIPAEVRYFAGGEGVEGPMAPSRLSEYLYRPADDLTSLSEKYGVEAPSDRMTLWHGSNKEFDAFDRQFLGAGEGRGSTALGNARGSGFYFNDLPPGQGINESRLPKGQTVAEYYADLISRTGGGSPNLYEVSVPKGPLLDYSKPLAQQSPETLAALKSMLGERWVDANPDADVNRVRSAARDHARYSRSLEERMADKDKSPDQIEAETLRRYGIIGTIHQDTPARIMGGSNYAIFDPEDIQIVNRRSLSEKYGLEPK